MKNLRLVILWIIIIGFPSCQWPKTYNLETLLEANLTPPNNTHTLTFSINGNFTCPFEFYLLLEGSVYQKISLHGVVVDTIVYRGDWYGSELSFKSINHHCIDKEASAKITWYTL